MKNTATYTKKRPAYPAYKDSGIEWLGEIPKHWGAFPLRRLIKFVKTGNTPSGAEENHFEENGFNWYSPSDFSEALYLGTANRTLSDVGKAEVRIFPDMTVMLVGIGATIGKVGLALTESSCNQQINAIVCNSLLDSVFATYYLKTMRDFIVKCGKFTTMPIINQDETKNLTLTNPPLPEQRAIAAFLDRETVRIDGLIEKKQRQIELLQEKRAALISHAVTKGLNPNAKMKDSGIEWLGKIPEHWEVKRLKRFSRLCSGESITALDITESGNFPVYGGNGLRGFTNSFTHEGKYVLIGRQGALCGCINYASGRFWASEHAVVVNTLDNISTIWLGELLRNMNLNQYSQSAAQPGLAVDTISALFVPFPPHPEQRAIAAFLDRETARIDGLIKKVEESMTLLREYRTALISAAVTGKIDVRGENA